MVAKMTATACFARSVKLFREDRHDLQVGARALGAKLGVAEKTAERVLKGTANLTFSSAEQIAGKLGAQLWEMLLPDYDPNERFIASTERAMESEVNRRVSEELQKIIERQQNKGVQGEGGTRDRTATRPFDDRTHQEVSASEFPDKHPPTEEEQVEQLRRRPAARPKK